MKCAIICVLTLCALFRVSTAPAMAQTKPGNPLKYCTNQDAILKAMNRKNEEMALVDPGRYQAARAAARELYRCAVTTTNSRTRDITTVLYASSLSGSFSTADEMIVGLPQLINTMKSIAATTKVPGLREDALKLVDLMSQEYDLANQEINGDATPSKDQRSP